MKKHDTADKLYCEEIDCGEDQPRHIASGLVPHYTLEEMKDRRLIVICNLKPKSLVGFKSKQSYGKLFLDFLPKLKPKQVT